MVAGCVVEGHKAVFPFCSVSPDKGYLIYPNLSKNDHFLIIFVYGNDLDRTDPRLSVFWGGNEAVLRQIGSFRTSDGSVRLSIKNYTKDLDRPTDVRIEISFDSIESQLQRDLDLAKMLLKQENEHVESQLQQDLDLAKRLLKEENEHVESQLQQDLDLATRLLKEENEQMTNETTVKKEEKVHNCKRELRNSDNIKKESRGGCLNNEDTETEF
jgi:hypothetical protein